jgi:serine/threonine protein kinase
MIRAFLQKGDVSIALTPGTPVGRYEIVALLGMGAMGEVYYARDRRLNRMVALKILPGHLHTLPERRDRFVQEARLASSLQHPNIVTIFDIGTVGPVTYRVGYRSAYSRASIAPQEWPSNPIDSS